MKRRSLWMFGMTMMAAALLLAACSSGGEGGTAATLASIAVIPANSSIATGNTRQFTATGTYTDGSTQDITNSVTWTSSDTTRGTISATGLATAASNATGSATIRATSGDISGSTLLNVKVNLAQTGQTVCYDAAGAVVACSNTGQDGDKLAGAAWPNPRFTNPDGTTPVTGSVVVDQLTGLMWLKDANCINTNYASFDNDGTAGDGGVTWQHALDFVAGIDAGTYTNCGGGHTDWRLPNREELRSIINYGQSNNITWLNTQGFSSVQANAYGSSTTHAAYTTYAWYVYMHAGYVYAYNKANYYYVWPVRSGQ